MIRTMRLVAWLPLVLVAGCALPGSRSDLSTFFVLTASEGPDEASAAGSWDVLLGLGPVTVPGYLDRPQLVTRVGPSELRLAPAARWAEPLREGIVRVLQQDLVAASGARTVTPYPWPPSARVDLAVAVDVLRFESSGRGDAELVARWSVREGAHGGVLAVRESHVAEPVRGTGTGAQVDALSRALGALGREIAAGVREAKR